MGIWRRLFRRNTADEPAADADPEPPVEAEDASNTVDLPVDPFVFECQSCGKVFEARRKRPLCPECDSRDVTPLTDA